MSRMPASPERAALHAFIARHQRFLLTTHVNPDGDAIGSEVAFARWLRAVGKSVRVLNDSPTPRAFAWLADEGPVEVYDEALAETRFAEADAFVVIDTGNKQRIGRLAEPTAHFYFQLIQMGRDFMVEAFGDAAMFQVVTARLSGNDESGRYRQAEIGHLGQVGALTAQQIL